MCEDSTGLAGPSSGVLFAVVVVDVSGKLVVLDAGTDMSYPSLPLCIFVYTEMRYD